MAVGPATLTLDQAEDTPVQGKRSAAFAWSYAYSRAAETREAGALGQDRLVVRVDDAVLAFALCDGVSQSFFGDLAARLLADGLVDWLWTAAPPTTDAGVLSEALSGFLADLSRRATAEVHGYVLPADLSDWVQAVLERKRQHGSESTFVCGRIDRPGQSLPAGRMLLAWLGDSRLRIWGPGGERTAELGGEFLTAQRWSTLRGPLGSPPHVFTAPLMAAGVQALTAMLAYSDGLAALDRLPGIPDDEALSRLVSQAGEAPTSDDISVLAIREIAAWAVPAPEPAGALAAGPSTAAVPTVSPVPAGAQPAAAEARTANHGPNRASGEAGSMGAAGGRESDREAEVEHPAEIAASGTEPAAGPATLAEGPTALTAAHAGEAEAGPSEGPAIGAAAARGGEPASIDPAPASVTPPAPAPPRAKPAGARGVDDEPGAKGLALARAAEPAGRAGGDGAGNADGTGGEARASAARLPEKAGGDGIDAPSDPGQAGVALPADTREEARHIPSFAPVTAIWLPFLALAAVLALSAAFLLVRLDRNNSARGAAGATGTLPGPLLVPGIFPGGTTSPLSTPTMAPAATPVPGQQAAPQGLSGPGIMHALADEGRDYG